MKETQTITFYSRFLKLGDVEVPRGASDSEIAQAGRDFFGRRVHRWDYNLIPGLLEIQEKLYAYHEFMGYQLTVLLAVVEHLQELPVDWPGTGGSRKIADAEQAAWNNGLLELVSEFIEIPKENQPFI
jgi:hypothetical protein